MTEQTENSSNTTPKLTQSTRALLKRLDELEERLGSKLKDILLDLDGKLTSMKSSMEKYTEERCTGIAMKLETLEKLFLQIALDEEDEEDTELQEETTLVSNMPTGMKRSYSSIGRVQTKNASPTSYSNSLKMDTS